MRVICELNTFRCSSCDYPLMGEAYWSIIDGSLVPNEESSKPAETNMARLLTDWLSKHIVQRAR